jgi:hypothetical protein
MGITGGRREKGKRGVRLGLPAESRAVVSYTNLKYWKIA